MRHYCQYHPISPAKWHCSTCNIYLDNACVPGYDEAKQQASCPHCKKRMTYFRNRSIKQPFWQVSSRFFTQPFQVELLLIALLAAVISSILSMLPSLNILGSSLIGLTVVHMGMCLIRHKAKQPEDSIRITQLIDNNYFLSDLLLGLILMLLGGLCIAIGKFLGLGLAIFFAVIVCLILPTLIISFALGSNIKHALSIDSLVQPISQMDKSYLLTTAYIVIAIFSTLVVADFLDQHAAEYLFTPIIFACSIYFGFALCAMFGYVITEYDHFRQAQNLKQSGSSHYSSDDTASGIDTRLDIALKDGNYFEALGILESEIKRHPDSEFRRNQFLKLCIALNDMTRIEKHVHAIMRMLLSRNQVIFAKTVLLKLQEHDENFKLHDLDISLELVRYFQKHKNIEMVKWLADDAHIRFDLCPELAELYLVAAKTLISNRTGAKSAHTYLRFIVQNFADEAPGNSARILLAHLEKHAAGT